MNLDLNLTNINYAKEVIEGTKHIERLFSEEERGRIEGGIRNVEASNDPRTSKGANFELPEREKDAINPVPQYKYQYLFQNINSNDRDEFKF